MANRVITPTRSGLIGKIASSILAPIISKYAKKLLNNIVYDNGLDSFGKPKGLGTIYKNELLEKKKEKKEKFDFQSAFGKICSLSKEETPF